MDNIAPKGMIWVCGACGKRTKDRYGTDGGWDESCMLNAVLVPEDARYRHLFLNQFGQPIKPA